MAQIVDEEDYLDEADEVIDFAFSITSYGADYPVDSLVRRLQKKDIIVPIFNWKKPKQSEILGFQRDYVWPRPKADRFIESLLLGLPVPGIFLVKEDSGVLLVLDGHQRLHTLDAYYEGIINGEEYKLGDEVQERFQGKSYRELDSEDRRRLDDSIIHATVVRQDSPTEDQSSVYIIFERLNTGGVTLQPQEIRVALYHGTFVELLLKLNENKAWRSLVGAKSKRLKDIELILRFFAFLYYADQYRSPMKDFLNKYMASNRWLKRQSSVQLSEVFAHTVDIISEAVGPSAFRPKRFVNAAVVDSLMVGVASRIIDRSAPLKNVKDFTRRYEKLLADQSYVTATETGTSQEANVRDRMLKAVAAFKTAV